MEAKKSNTALIVIIVVIVLCVLCIAPFMVGVVFLWAQTFTSETVEQSNTLNVRCSADASEDTISVEVISGSVSWYEYQVKANGILLSTTSFETSVGDEAIFTGLEFEPWESIDISISEMDAGRIAWSDTITAQ